MSEDKKKKSENKEDGYYFGGIKEFNLEEIEAEVLNDSVYLDVFAGSDIRFKQNVEPLAGSVEKIMSLNAMKYDYKSEAFPNKNFSSNKQIGFMAQSVEKVLPELVATDNDGYKAINYAHLTPVLAEAIKELNNKIETLEKKIKELESK
ncbi:MAG: tail fiber domain-containing protein [Bacteriovoracaceae bacterium]|nr:tail fiber domain-containing protein [Bacteriovoracaceae bacterium]